MVLVIIFRGKMELKEGSGVKILYEDGFFDKACAVNCIYFWPDSVADLKDNLSCVQPKCGNSRLAFKMSLE
jgi:hypothetical protein